MNRFEGSQRNGLDFSVSCGNIDNQIEVGSCFLKHCLSSKDECSLLYKLFCIKSLI